MSFEQISVNILLKLSRKKKVGKVIYLYTSLMRDKSVVVIIDYIEKSDGAKYTQSLSISSHPIHASSIESIESRYNIPQNRRIQTIPPIVTPSGIRLKGIL